MKKVAKLVIVDANDHHLLMYRSDHPRFGADPDLPGGTHEEGESLLETMIREVQEEAGILVDQAIAEEVYSGTDYSDNVLFSLYKARLPVRPKVQLSWEHSRYEWLDREAFLAQAKNAQDTYMHMVHDVLK